MLQKLAKSYLFLILTVSSMAFLMRCSFPTPLGEDIVQSEILDIVFIDTIGIRLSTVIFDSIATSNTNRHLLGHYEDQSVGAVTSIVFSQLSLDSLRKPDEEAVYQYAELELIHDGYFHYDTVNEFEITVYQLSEELELNDDDYLTNLSVFNYNIENPLGTSLTQPRPLSNREILVPIRDDFALDLFSGAREQEDDFLEDFNELFPGIVIVPDTTSNSSFYGFSTTSKLIIHYRESGEDEELVFPLSGLRFNQINNDRSRTSLAELETSKEDISSTRTGNQVHLHNAIGTAIKVEIPFLRDIRSVLQSNFITEANLVLRPVKGTYSNVNPLPQQLIFYEVDDLNRVEQIIQPVGGLITDDEFNEDTEYRFDITDFVQEKIDEGGLEEHSLLIQGLDQELGTNVEQLVVGDRFNEFEATLELFILDYIIDN